MKEINVRVGQCPYSGKFESTINGTPKPLQETWKLANEMLQIGAGNPIVINGEEYIVEKALFQGDRLVAESRG